MIYLNNADTSYPKPVEVIKSVTQNIQNLPFNSVPSRLDKKNDINVINECRKRLARLINTNDPNNIIFTSGATEALNLVIRGLPLTGSHIITTNIEHNSVLRPLYEIVKEKHIGITIVDSDEYGNISPDDIIDAIQPNTKAIIINHGSNVVGSVTDIGKISEIAHQYKFFFVLDASQTMGRIPIDLNKHNIDFLVFTGHKALYGISGIGGLYIKRSLDIKPLKVGGTRGFMSNEKQQPHQRPIYYESGTLNLPGIASLEAGTSFVLDKGFNRIMRKDKMLLESVVDSLRQIPSVKLHLDNLDSERLPIVSFNIDNIIPSDVGYVLEKTFGIIIRTGLHCSPLIHHRLGTSPAGTVRISLSYFNTIEDIDYFIDSVEKISHGKNLFKKKHIYTKSRSKNNT